MEVTVIRGARRHRAVAETASGVVQLVVHDYGPLLPHDLVHLVVEDRLGLRFGFWGLLAAGARPESVRTSFARHPRHLRPPADPLVAAHRHQLDEAERLVAALYPLDGAPAAVPGLPDREAARVRAAVDDVHRRWRALAVGGRLSFTWPEGTAA